MGFEQSAIAVPDFVQLKAEPSDLSIGKFNCYYFFKLGN